MWMWHCGSNGSWSPDRPVSPIANDLISPGNFIALGRRVPASQARVPAILADFDRLLPLYVYVETDGELSAPLFASEGSDFEAGCPEFAEATTATTKSTTVDVALRHQVLQRALYEHLCREAGKENVRFEYPLPFGRRADAVVRGGIGLTFYEMKVASTVQSCVRGAVGQLLEYAHWPSADRAHELIVVGEAVADEVGAGYLQLLRERFRLPLWYRRIDVEEGTLGSKT